MCSIWPFLVSKLGRIAFALCNYHFEDNVKLRIFAKCGQYPSTWNWMSSADWGNYYDEDHRCQFSAFSDLSKEQVAETALGSQILDSVERRLGSGEMQVLNFWERQN